MPQPTPSPISPLRGLLEVTSLVRAEEDLPELLGAIARTISETLGYQTVVINLFRPAWNDFTVTTVHGGEQARAALLGQHRTIADWETLLDARFERRGAYVVYAGGNSSSAGEDAWQPEDELFLPMRHADGHLLGVVSVDEPLSRRRPNDTELDVLVALADHAALAVQSAQDASEAARHRLALEHLLGVSSRLTAEPDADEILRAVCRGVRDALGFEHVAAQLIDPETGVLDARAAVGWRLDGPAMRSTVLFDDVAGVLDPEFEVAGCFLVPSEEAARRVPRDKLSYVSHRNGAGPRAWNRHWLVVPLRDSAGEPIGLIWADEPEDRLLPSEEKLQALRIFANQAAAAIVSAAHQTELRFLADHDPLTRLMNRRAFVERLDGEVARARRYRRSFGLVLCDLDGFKELNDRFGHAVGDEALQLFARVLNDALRKPDDAFRIGGDEFALLLAEATDDDAREVVARVSSLLAATGDRRLAGVRASFGVASCPEDASEAQVLFRLADEALYEAKRNGSGLQFVA